MAVYRLTNGPDSIENYEDAANNTWYAFKGEDQLFLGYGNDVVYAGNGADTVYPGLGSDTVYGGDGWDWIVGGGGFDTLKGEKGNDVITDSDLNGNYDGGIGNDFIQVHGGIVDAGDGNDTVQAVIRDDVGTTTTITLGKGADTLEIDGETWRGFNRVIVKDFHVEDHLLLTATDLSDRFDYEEVLNKIDRNDDGWVGRKDVAYGLDQDGFGVSGVGKNFLELQMGDDHIVLQGMVKASFDFLS